MLATPRALSNPTSVRRISSCNFSRSNSPDSRARRLAAIPLNPCANLVVGSSAGRINTPPLATIYLLRPFMALRTDLPRFRFLGLFPRSSKFIRAPVKPGMFGLPPGLLNVLSGDRLFVGIPIWLWFLIDSNMSSNPPAIGYLYPNGLRSRMKSGVL